jgi:hypothetical protein
MLDGKILIIGRKQAQTKVGAVMLGHGRFQNLSDSRKKINNHFRSTPKDY